MTKLDDDSGEILTVARLHTDIAEQLLIAGVEDHETSARRIVEEATGIKVDLLPLEKDQPVTQKAVARADAMSQRRAQGEPLQYVIGSWNFRYLDLAVDPRALIPRPETEVVAGFAIDQLKMMNDGTKTSLLVADMGTGTGAIALSIAQEVPTSRIHATDISTEALSLARSNLAGLGTDAARVDLHQGDWFEALPEELSGELDVLISNPPYISPTHHLLRS